LQQYGQLTNKAGASITGGTGTYLNDGGTGVSQDVYGKLTNYGKITGGAGTYGLVGGPGGTGVALTGTVTNENGGTITGGAGGSGLYVLEGGNGGTGVALTEGTVTNDNGATITGGAGGYGFGESSDLSGTGGTGVSLSAGKVTNEAGGTITGGAGGVGFVFAGTGGLGVNLGGGTLTNDGTITGGAGGSVSEFFGRSSIGGVGVDLNGGTLTTSGTISGGKGIGTGQADAVQFGSYAGTLIVEPGAVFNGQVAANPSVDDTLQLSGTQSGGTGITLGTQFTGFQTLDFATGAAWTVDAGAGAAPYGGLTLEGFAIGDTIDVTNLTPKQVAQDFGVAYTSLGGGNYAFNGSAGGETLTTASDGTLVFSGNFSGDHFVLSGDGTDIQLMAGPVCFLRGTRIRTVAGEKAVEDLTVGERVLTASGQSRPIRWIGTRGLDCTSHPKPDFVWPVRIQSGAFAEDLPVRDLWVSPFHAILVEGVLIQVEKLVNGATIVQVPRERVEYWHVELDSHDILLAEGLPAESYLDVGNRTAFVNGGDYLEEYPDFAPKDGSETCVPMVKEGPVIERAKAALLARAQALGYQRTEDPDLHILADGRRIDPVRLNERRVAFMLPAAHASIELRCRRFTPAQMNPSNDDVRVLGICVQRLQLDGADVALEDEAAFAQGWHALEHSGSPQGQPWRWSQDRMPLPVGTRLLVIDLCHQDRHYWAKPESTVVALFG